jgi:hypothetical protein
MKFNPGELLVDIAAAAVKKIRNRPKAVARRAAKRARDEVAEDFNSTDEGPEMLQGKLTYSMQAGMAIVFVGQLLGVDITQESAASIVGLALAFGGIYGRWRATK